MSEVQEIQNYLVYIVTNVNQFGLPTKNNGEFQAPIYLIKEE